MAATEEDETKRGQEALQRLRSADPPLYLSPSLELAQDARAAALYLYSSLVPYCPKPALDRLLVGDGFDAEQIWYQIDLLSRPLLSAARRDLNRIARDPAAHVLGAAGGAARDGEAVGAEKKKVIEEGEDDEQDGDESEEDEGEEEGEGESEEEEDDDDDDADEGDEDEDEEAGEVKKNNVEDKFLKIKDLEQYLDKEEEKEYGLQKDKGSRRKEIEMDEEEDEDEEEEDDDEEDGLDLGDIDSDGDEDTELAENARYEDFFGGNKKKQLNQNGIIGKRKRSSDAMDFPDRPESKELDVEENDNEGEQVLSTHEKALLKLHSKIEQMEKANLEPKSWTMQGEVTAAERPKNSALEVDLDFDHKVRPAPVITEEVTAALEDIIRKRIIEGHFDDVQRAPPLPSKAPRELKELDENKSKKGLAELYEEEYAQKSGLAPAPVSTSDTLKNEANMLFKKLCTKLDALSHFHFAPKPVIEDMSIQVNVPALAMEEIAPLAVSDAAMLAPEEIFEGKGDMKEETELTKEDRKRRRANKKRKFKAQMTKRAAKKTGQNRSLPNTNAKADS